MRALVIEDDEVDQINISKNLDNVFDKIDYAPTAKEAIDFCEKNEYDILIVDYKLPDTQGVELVKKLLKYGSPIIGCTGQGCEIVAVQFIQAGADDYLPKSQFKLLKSKVLNILKHSQKKADFLDKINILIQNRLKEAL